MINEGCLLLQLNDCAVFGEPLPFAKRGRWNLNAVEAKQLALMNFFSFFL
jgi:hypothetical protein